MHTWAYHYSRAHGNVSTVLSYPSDYVQQHNNHIQIIQHLVHVVVQRCIIILACSTITQTLADRVTVRRSTFKVIVFLRRIKQHIHQAAFNFSHVWHNRRPRVLYKHTNFM